MEQDSRLEVLERRVAVLEDLLQREILINQQQTDSIARKQRENRRWIEALATAMLGFFGFCLVVLAGLRLEFGWGSFALPADLFQTGAIAGAITAGSKYVLDRQQAK